MTKYQKILILIISIVLVLALFSSSVYVKEKTIDINASENFNARKEDLLAKQLELETAILELNKTLQTLKENELILANQLSNLTGSQVSLSNATKTAPTSTQTTTSTPKITQTSPSRPRVTRAS